MNIDGSSLYKQYIFYDDKNVIQTILCCLFWVYQMAPFELNQTKSINLNFFGA